MQDRRPRKLKKQLKKRYEASICVRDAQCIMVAMQSAVRVAIVNAMPMDSPDVGGFKALEISRTVLNTHEAINNVMQEGPQNWREA